MLVMPDPQQDLLALICRFYSQMKELPPPEKSRSTIPDMPQKSPIDGGSYTRVIMTVPFRGALHFKLPF